GHVTGVQTCALPISILGQVLALSIANLLQELADLVTLHSPIPAPPPPARLALAPRCIVTRPRARENARRRQRERGDRRLARRQRVADGVGGGRSEPRVAALAQAAQAERVGGR